MDYNTAMSQFEEDLERSIHNGDKERVEAIKREINHLKKHRFDWFHNGFYDYKTGEWHTMKPEDAEYLATCGMSDEEIVEYVNSREEHRRKFNQSMSKYESMKKNDMGDLIHRQDAILWLLEKGQKSERYKFGETWELNFEEIKDALSKVPEASPLGGYSPFSGYKFDKNSESNTEVGMYKEPVNIDIPSIHPGMNEIGSDKTNSRSSKIAELIANMVFNDADEEEITRIVAYSINVIEAEKCIRKRDASYFDNDIAQLEKKYSQQNSKKEGEE